MSGEGDDRLERLLAVVEAQGARLEALTLERQPAKAAAATITLRALFCEFTKSKQAVTHWGKIRARLDPLVVALGDLPSMELTPYKWAEHVAVRAVTPTRHDRPPSAQTLLIELMRAKGMLEFGVANGFLPSNPLAAVERPKVISQRETWLDEAGIQALLDNVTAAPEGLPRVLLRAFILLCTDSMMRFEEARKLRRDRIRDGVIELSAKKTKGKKRRILGLTPRTLDAIAAVPPFVGDPHIFVSPETGKLYGQTTIRRWFREACVAAGIDALAADGERVVIHTLRHSGASAADARGASAIAIRDALGHSSLAITERYLHRHREAGARDLAKLMHDGAATERQRKGPQKAPQDNEAENTFPLPRRA